MILPKIAVSFGFSQILCSSITWQGWIFFRKAAISSGNNFTYLKFGEGFWGDGQKKIKEN